MDSSKGWTLAGRHAKRKTRSRSARLRVCAVVGLPTTAGAFLAAAVGSIAPAPQAKADFGIDDLIMNLLDPGVLAAAAEPAATLDLSTLLADLVNSTGVTDTAALAIPDLPDPGSVVAGAVDVCPAAVTPCRRPPPDAVAAAADPTFDLSGLLAFFGFVGTGAPDSTAFADSFQEGFYQPVDAFIQNWINSPVGEFADNGINGLFHTPSDICGVICNGAPGTLADPTGQGGGLLPVTAGPAMTPPRIPAWPVVTAGVPDSSVTAVTAAEAGLAPTVVTAAPAARSWVTAGWVVLAVMALPLWPLAMAVTAGASAKTSLMSVRSATVAPAVLAGPAMRPGPAVMPAATAVPGVMVRR